MNAALPGRAVLAILVAFFAVIFFVNAAFIVSAVTTFRGEDEESSYLQGIDYNATLAKRAVQNALGWRATIAADPNGRGHTLVTAELTTAQGEPIPHLKLIGILRHPSDANRDRRIALVERAAGSYSADIAGITKGSWDVVLESAEPDKPPFEAERRLWFP